jgi:beta-N-acetylhexosaminidase
VLLGLLWAVAASGTGPARAQTATPPFGDPRELLARLTPAERVAQLFIAPLWVATGAEGDGAAGAPAGLHDLGGVLLTPAQDSFTNTVEAPAQVAALTAALQRRARDGPPGIPPLVAVADGGDGYPDSTLWGGLTPLPSPMSLGATWQPEHAERVGEVVGRELAALGVNVLIGPLLDVSAVPRPGASGDLGVRTFGGSAPWVAAFGRRYVAGVHRGSLGRVATMAGNFPGIGAADRSQAEELPVVESTLSDLAALELLPFAAVTGPPTREAGRTDGLLTSHVRFRSVQQQADRPMSLDSGGLRYLWAQVPAVDAWRAAQGVLLSPPLGAPAVRRYLDPVGGTLNLRRVAREALMAGHDLLLLTELGPPAEAAAQRAAVADTRDWLAGEYAADQALRQAVDDAALRVLTLKQRLGLFGPAPSGPPLAEVGLGADAVNQVARAALTRIAPASAAPRQGERVLFIVDARPVQECETCPVYPSPDPERVLGLVRRAYGPSGTARLTSDEDAAAITFRELKAWLQAAGRVRSEDTVALVEPLPTRRLNEIGQLLRRSDWLAFLMRDVRPQEDAGSDAMKLYLKAAPPALAPKKLVAIALSAPYYLDATEIAKLSAYFAVYSRSDPFLNVALRGMFGDEAAPGASPVSVPGVGYDMARVVAPALDQTPGLDLVGHDPAVPVSGGATLVVRSDTVEDANGHPVPDGTHVRIRRYDRADGVFLPDIDATTVDGRVTVDMRADRPGRLSVTAAFENGLSTRPLDLTIEPPGLFPLQPPDLFPRPRVAVDWGILFLSLAFMLLAGALVYATDAEAARTPGRLLRVLLLSLCWGLAGYLLVAAGGLHVSTLPFGVAGWPAGWNVAYQAPMLSFLLALLPVVWTIRRSRAGRR